MASYYTKSRHHFALTSPAADSTSGLAKGDIMGFTCMNDPQTGTPFYKELDGQYLVDLFYNSQADQTAKNPQEDLPIILSDYRSGFSADIQDYDTPKKYFSSYGCDLRAKDRVILSYGSTPILIPSAIATVTGFVDGASAWTDEAKAYDNDTATVAYDTVAAATWSEFLELTFTSSTAWGVRTYATVETNPVGTQIDIDLYYGAAWNHLYEGTYTVATWVYHILSAPQTGVTAIRVRIKNGDALEPRRVFLYEAEIIVSSSVTTTFAEAKFNDLHYIGMNRILSKVNTAGTGCLAVQVLPSNITDLEPMTIGSTDFLFIAQGFANNYYYANTAETFTLSTAATAAYEHFAVVYTTAATLYGNDTNSTLRSTVNPLNAGTAWSATTQVDNDAYNITSLFSKSGALYIGKEDKPYYLNSAGAVQNDLAPECESLTSSTSGKIVHLWQGEAFYSVGAQSLLRIGTTNSWISPSKYCTKLPDFSGKIVGLASDGEWLIAATNNTTTVEIIMGRDETVDGTTSWVWHPYQQITMANCERIFTSTYFQNRVYVVSPVGTMVYSPLPVGYGDLTSDANRSFPISASAYYFETPFLHGRFKSDTKGWIKVVATLGHAYDANIYWTIQYKKLQDSAYTNIGNLVGTATDRTHTLYLPVDGSSNNPVSPMMRFKLIGVTNDTSKTPVLLGLDFRAVLYPTRKDIIWAKVKVAKEMMTMGGKSVDKYAKLKACLEACRDATYPVTMKDIDDATTQVRFLELPQGLPWKEPMTDEAKRDRDYVFNCLMLKTPTS